jgi:hypothetical protein
MTASTPKPKRDPFAGFGPPPPGIELPETLGGLGFLNGKVRPWPSLGSRRVEEEAKTQRKAAKSSKKPG